MCKPLQKARLNQSEGFRPREMPPAEPGDLLISLRGVDGAEEIALLNILLKEHYISEIARLLGPPYTDLVRRQDCFHLQISNDRSTKVLRFSDEIMAKAFFCRFNDWHEGINNRTVVLELRNVGFKAVMNQQPKLYKLQGNIHTVDGQELQNLFQGYAPGRALCG